MIGKLNHVAIAVPDLDEAARIYRDVLGAKISQAYALPEHGVTAVFVHLNNTNIELMQPLGNASTVRKFLESHPKGGLHHVCYEVEDIFQARDQLIDEGMTIVGDGEPYLGAHDKLVIFLHPKDFLGTLIELEQSS